MNAPLFVACHEFIKALKEECERTLNSKKNIVRPENIRWVLTVPALWTDAGKQFMRDAAEEVTIR